MSGDSSPLWDNVSGDDDNLNDDFVEGEDLYDDDDNIEMDDEIEFLANRDEDVDEYLSIIFNAEGAHGMNQDEFEEELEHTTLSNEQAGHTLAEDLDDSPASDSDPTRMEGPDIVPSPENNDQNIRHFPIPPGAKLCCKLSKRNLMLKSSHHRPADTSIPIHKYLKGSHLHHIIGTASGILSRKFRDYRNFHTIRLHLMQGKFGNTPLDSRHYTLARCNHLPHNPSLVNARYIEHVFCGTYSRNGNMFMSACQDEVLRLYDTSREKWSLKRSIPVRDVGWAVVDTCYSPNEQYVIYSSWSDAIRLVTLEGDRHEDLVLLDDEASHVQICPFSIRFSKDSSNVLAGINRGWVALYDINMDRNRLMFTAHNEDVNAVAFLDDSTDVFISGSDDALCKVWDLRMVDNQQNEPIGAFRGHTHGITFLDSKNDGRYFISQSKDCTIKLWDMRAMRPNDDVHAPRLAMADYRWCLVQPTQRRLRGDSSLMTYSGHRVARTLMRARFSPETTAQSTGNIFIWDVLTGEEVSRFPVHENVVRDVSWHPRKTIITSSSWDGTVQSLTTLDRADIIAQRTATARGFRMEDGVEADF
eukprot:gene7597-7712_t